MKKILQICSLCIVSLIFISCGKGDEGSKIDSQGYLPTRIEDIENGGVIPEGCEAKVIVEESDYDISSFWGNWILKDYSVPESGYAHIYITDTVLNYDVVNDSGDKITLTAQCFPGRLEFHPASITSRDIYSLKRSAEMEQSSWFGEKPENLFAENNKTVLIEESLEKLGYGIGNVKFLETKDYDYADLSMPMLLNDIRAVTYVISDNKIAIGLLDADCPFGDIIESPSESEILEIDYEFSWNGNELSLTYNGETAVYIPEKIKHESSVILEEAGLSENSDPIDGIYGISYNEESSIAQVMKDTHEGYIDAEISFEEDTVIIDNKVYPYVYAGESLTLFTEDGNCSVYSNYTFSLQSFNQIVSTNFLAGNQTISAWDTVGWFMENGFTTDIDLSMVVNPGTVTNDIVLEYNDSHITIKANNPYENVAPLKDCEVCYILIDDVNSVIRKGDSKVGETTYSEIDQMYEAAYEKKPNSLRYKTTLRGGIIISGISSFDYGPRKVNKEGYEIIYEFEKDILKSVRIEVPTLLYNGLQDNVDYDTLQNMSATNMTGVMEIRDDVLSKLSNAFEKAGISVDINENTGEITMDTNVLFGFDSAELSSEGKKYIDSFMGVYASVILDDSLKDVISEIRFEGHTDSSGNYDYNLNLSQRRAETVLEYCLSGDASSMNRDQKERLNDIATAIGYSYADLVYDDSGNENADASRRVAVKFYINVDKKDDVYK